MHTSTNFHGYASQKFESRVSAFADDLVTLTLYDWFSPVITVFLTREQLGQVKAEIEAFQQDEALTEVPA